MDTTSIEQRVTQTWQEAQRQIEKAKFDALNMGTKVNYHSSVTGRFTTTKSGIQVTPEEEDPMASREEAIQRVIDKAVKVAVKDAVAWLVAENDNLRQQCEELEIEIEVEKSAWAEPDDNVVFPKHRGLFKDEN